jgi:hypothetical protein
MSYRSPLLFSCLCVLAACNGLRPGELAPSEGITLDGRVDKVSAVAVDHSQHAARHAGYGDDAAVHHVTIWQVTDAFSQTQIIDAEVNEHFHFDAVVPAGRGLFIVSAVDKNGAEISSTLVAVDGKKGESITLAPLVAETTVESQVFMATRNLGVTPAEVDIVDLRLRIDAAVAEAVLASHEPATEVDRLAEGIVIGQRARAEIWARRGVPVTPASLFPVYMKVLQDTDDRRYAGERPDERLFDIACAVETENGVSLDIRAAASSAQSMALRRTLLWRAQETSVSAHAGHPAEVESAVMDAAGIATARMEAKVLVEAVSDVLARANADSAMQQAAQAAADKLIAAVSEGSMVEQLALAFSEYHNTVVGFGGGSMSVLNMRVDPARAFDVIQFALGKLATLNTQLTGALAPVANAVPDISVWSDAYANTSLSFESDVEGEASRMLASDAAFASELISLSLSTYR